MHLYAYFKKDKQELIMTERVYRLVVGILMMFSLFFQLEIAMWALLCLMTFEGLTNWRIPIVISKLIYSNDTIKVTEGDNPSYSINYDAERMLRWIVLFLILLGTIKYTNEHLWFFPWFVGLMLLLAGITGICPMVMALRKLGLK